VAQAAPPLRVVTTVAPLTDLVQQIGRSAIRLHGLVPAGVNSHTFQPAPSDVRYIAEADLIILNGLHLELPTEKLAHKSGKPGMRLLKLGDRTIHQAQWLFDESFPASQGHPNPHLWLNVAYARTYVELIRDHLSSLDAANAQIYHDNAASYLRRLTRLDQCIMMAIETIPAQHRLLLTYHDSWPYFARRYGMTVLGAVQPANFFEPSPRDVARIIDQIRATRVPAIFGSEVFPSAVLEKIAAETGVRYVSTLRDDVLPGAPGDVKHSYIGMMLDNVHTMAEALGGKPQTMTACATPLLHESQ
jgi:ABC-type Zn uptake system ZnuABC Zn-binding protein ZnuA